MSIFDFEVTHDSPNKDSPYHKHIQDSWDFRHPLDNLSHLYKKGKIPKVKTTEVKTTIIIYTRTLDYKCGGIVALHNLAKQINDLKNPNVQAKLFVFNNLKYSNNFCEDFASIDDADENAIVVYPEVIAGNPLNAKNVVRWILLDLEFEMGVNHYLTWHPTDLVYYFNSKVSFYEDPDKNGVVYKLLNCLYIAPFVKHVNFNERTGSCFTIRKANFLKLNLNYFHPTNSFEITEKHTQQNCIELFNNYKYFICYDPICFYVMLAIMCGCISIVYPLEGKTKKEWIQSTMAAEYCKFKGIDNLYGIAYGMEDLEYATSTIDLAHEQWVDIINFGKNNVTSFVNDLINIDLINTNKNTVHNIFINK
jgi:hypothetical protein